MDMFAVDDDVAQWEAALQSRRGAERLPLLLLLAWHLRQRDTTRALALAHEVDALLPNAALSAEQRTLAAARMALVRAESHWLNGALDEAQAQAGAILDTCGTLSDQRLCADAHWLIAAIAVDRGDHGEVDAGFARAAAAARAAGDELRALLAEAAQARSAVQRDRVAAQARFGELLNADSARRHPALAALVNDYLALAASKVVDFGAATSCFIGCFEAAQVSGQLRVAIIAAANIGENFTMLGDHQTALEWHHNALELARPTGWPLSIGACLMQSADTLRRLGQLGPARVMLDQALAALAPFHNARIYAIALQYLGDLALDSGDFSAALDAFIRVEARANALGQANFHSAARRGQAHALLHLGRGAEALEVAASAVAMAAEQAHAHNHIAALRVMAIIHARQALPAPSGMTEASPVLHYLRQALSVAADIEGYAVPCDLFDAMAREYAGAGDYARAYDIALAASAAREKSHGQETTNRAIAMQVHHQTAQARIDGQHHRELALSEARRAAVLQHTSDTLERLSAIGQEITAHLDAAAVFRALDRHIHALLGASTFAIYLTDADGSVLQRAFGVEMGRPMPPNAIPLSDPHAYSVRCLAEQREIYIAHWPDEDLRKVARDDHLSALFVPLNVGARAIGVMTVQASVSHAYGDNERMIFRTLCAYGAIALDNAEAYRQLKDAQTQLVSQEKLAALGSLMAGVAHELNTPIGNSLLIASTMQAKSVELETLMQGPGLRRSELAAYLDDTKTASVLVLRGLTSAAELVNSFKQVAVDRTTEQRRTFNLLQVCRESIATMMNRIRAANHSIEVRIDAAIELDSYPGPFGQVVTNFINNALLHAFSGERRGHMLLSARNPVDGRVLIEFCDDGEGIAQAHLGRIFDPFFTTKLGQGGSGLGLSISYNIVTALLGGQVAVVSSAHGGTCFTLDLPLCAPAPPPAAPGVSAGIQTRAEP
ncbi:MAG: GAF domain-containing sensor histidine kinase [Pseudomonadota bacterium]|nr:GAF domain-containing sensor histidine kinase [Pseudomonadota bacterium]